MRDIVQQCFKKGRQCMRTLPHAFGHFYPENVPVPPPLGFDPVVRTFTRHTRQNTSLPLDLAGVVVDSIPNF